jgi:hypothetical protein
MLGRERNILDNSIKSFLLVFALNKMQYNRKVDA